jgi:SNF2 family DNA or RNA helicase
MPRVRRSDQGVRESRPGQEMTLLQTPPPLFKHQSELLERTRDERAWAIFWMTGTGKTCPTIRTAVHLFERGAIDRVVVVAPNMVHRNWISEEVPRHCPIQWSGLDWHSSRAKAQDRALEKLRTEPAEHLRWFAISFDALITPRGRQAVLDFVTAKNFLLVIDEGSRVKSPTAVRTKKVAALRKLAAYARLLNGTPVGSSAVDVYAQMKILDEHYWIRHGIGSFTAFQARFCVFRKIVVGGEDDREANEKKSWKKEPDYNGGDASFYEQLDLNGIVGDATTEPTAPVVRPATGTTGRTIEIQVGFRDLDKLHQMLQPMSSRLTKEQAGLDLPPKLYQRLVFELVPEQRRVYDQLRKEFMVELDGGALVTAPLAMVRILRLQQIACGYLPNPDDPEADPILIPGTENPRLCAFMDWLEDVGRQQVIVWCRFTHDVDLICRELGPAKCTRFDGEVTARNKEIALDLFKSDKRQVCVAKASSMGMGLTLAHSHLAFYYSNTFSLLERLQSEDRQHRPGQHNPVLYVDLLADRTVDAKILRSLREAHDVADRVTGDAYRSWLEEE